MQIDFGTMDPSVESGIQLSTDLNNWRDTVHSSHKGNVRPAYAVAGLVWVKDAVATAWEHSIYDGSEDVSLFEIDSVTHKASLKIDGLIQSSSSVFQIKSTNSTGTSYLDLDPCATGSPVSESSVIRLFRNTNSTSVNSLEIHLGNGTDSKYLTFATNGTLWANAFAQFEKGLEVGNFENLTGSLTLQGNLNTVGGYMYLKSGRDHGGYTKISQYSTQLRIGDAGNTNRITFWTNTGDVSIDGDFTVGVGSVIQLDASSEVGKVRLWGTSDSYSIGMLSAQTYGALNSYATTFSMAGATEGWLWRDNGHTDAQGAMSLTTIGELTILGASTFQSTLTVNGNLTMGNGADIIISADEYLKLRNNDTGYSLRIVSNVANNFGAVTSLATVHRHYSLANYGYVWVGGTTPLMSLSSFDGTFRLAGNATFESVINADGGIVLGTQQLKFGANQDTHKIHLWSNTDRYSIGMSSNWTYGNLSTYAMVFTMDPTTTMGWLWRTSTHSSSEGCMSLSTGGDLTVLGTIKTDKDMLIRKQARFTNQTAITTTWNIFNEPSVKQTQGVNRSIAISGMALNSNGVYTATMTATVTIDFTVAGGSVTWHGGTAPTFTSGKTYVISIYFYTAVDCMVSVMGEDI